MQKRPRCYLCQQRVPRKAFKKYGYDILKCPSCELYSLKFTQNYNSFINEYYNEEFFTGSDNRTGYADYTGDHWPESQNMRRYLKRISRFKTSGSLLDCGCATGLFLEEAQRIGFDVWGFDVSDFAVSKARENLGERVVKASLDTASYDANSFDLVTLFDVIEHLEDPKKALRKIKRWLKPDGLLVINTGDTSSLLAKLQGSNWHFFVPPQHLFFFSKRTLTNLLDQAGYEVIKIEYKGKWLSLRYFLNLSRQIYQNKLSKFLYGRVANNALGKIPLYFNLFDNILVYAKKKKPKR